MSETRKDDQDDNGAAMPDPRRFLTLGAGAAAASLLGCQSLGSAGADGRAASATTGASPEPQPRPGRRRLGGLEVSSIGLGVQNMSRTYQTTIPTRSEMFRIIRTAFDRGVTFYDAAEAYGPHEVRKQGRCATGACPRWDSTRCGARLPDQVLVFSGVEAPRRP